MVRLRRRGHGLRIRDGSLWVLGQCPADPSGAPGSRWSLDISDPTLPVLKELIYRDTPRDLAILDTLVVVAYGSDPHHGSGSGVSEIRRILGPGQTELVGRLAYLERPGRGRSPDTRFFPFAPGQVLALRGVLGILDISRPEQPVRLGPGVGMEGEPSYEVLASGAALLGHEAAVFTGKKGSRSVLQVVPFFSGQTAPARLLAAHALPIPLTARE